VVRRLFLAASIAAIIAGVAVKAIYARAAGNLDKPGISIPSTAEGTLDATAAAMNAVLKEHREQFVGGHYINTHSILQFEGGTKTINSLLAELSKIEGSILRVKFSSGSEFVESLPGAGEPPRPYDCVIEHNAWANADSLGITIYLGGNVSLEDLSLPAIRGHAAE
jgi:hypothetical protein